MKKILVFIAVLGLFFCSVKAQNPVAQPQYFLTWIKVKDSVRASIYFQGVDTLATKAYVRSLLGTKLGYSDTATMLSAYKTFYPRLAISVTNTGTSGAATYDPATGVLNVPVYTGGGGGGSVTSVAINNASGLTGTSPITSTGTIGADTTILSTKANVIASLLGYATTSSLTAKVNVSDTATMLGHYYNKTATDALLALKQNTITLTTTGTSGAATLIGSTLNIPQYSGGGGGGTVTSVATNAATGILGGTFTTSGTISADTVLLTTHSWHKKGIDSVANVASVANALKVNISDTATMLGSYYNKTAVDSKLLLKLNISDTSVMLANYYNKTASDARYATAANLALKLNISDTAAMLGNYYNKTASDSKFATIVNLALKVNISDTSAMLGNYYNKTALNALRALDVKYTDTSSMLANYVRTANYGIVKTGQAFGVDSTLLSTKANVVALLTGYATAANLALKVNISDTSTMLSNYYNKTALNALRALDVKYTDTSAMLSTYIRTANWGTVKTGQALGVDSTLVSTKANVVASLLGYATAANLALKVNISDTSAMLTPYVRTANYGITKTAQAMGVDTSTMSTKANVVALLTGYTAGALVVKYSDTATMLSSYYNKTAINSLNTLNVKYTDTAGIVGNYIRTANYGTVKTGQALGVDSTLVSTKANVTASLLGYAVNSLVVKYTDTASMLSTHPNSTFLAANLALKVNFTDTSSMLGNYVRTANYGIVKTGQAFGVDTTALSTKANVVALLTGYTAGALVVKYTDTASMLSTHPNTTLLNSSLALKQNTITLTTTGTSGAATLVGATLNIPTYSGGSGTVTNIATDITMTGGPITTTGTLKVDTTVISTKANVGALLTGYAAGSLVVKYTDTASMLSTHPNLTAVNSLNALNVKYTDTSSMLGNYVRTANYGIIKTGQAFGVDSTSLSTKANVVASLLGYATNTNLALKVNISDTAAMLSTHPNATALASNLALYTLLSTNALNVKYTDTTSMLSTHPNKTYVDANVATKQNTLTLTTTGTSGAATLIGATLNIPSYTAGTGTVTSVAINNLSGLTGTTPITTTGTIGLDTTIASTKANVTAKLIGYAPLVSPSFTTPSLGVATATSINTVVLSGSTTPTLAVTGTSSISGSNTGDNAVNTLYSGLAASKVNVSDTATMLSAYYNKTASDSKFFTIANAATKLNISDTATMLSTHPNLTYVTANLATKQNTISLTTTGTSGVATLVGSTLNIPNYASGGGGTTTNALTLGSGLTGTSFNGSVAVTATVDTAAFKIATKTDIKGDYYTIDGNVVSDSSYFTIKSLSGLQVDTVRLKYSTLTGGSGVTSLTTTGTSGAATLTGSVLNIPIYSGGGGSMSIGGSITSATAGSVLFAGTAGVLAQSNANLFWNNTNSYLGLGNATPHAPIEIANYATLGGRDYQTLFRPPTGIGARFAFVNQATTTGVMMGEGTGGNGDFVIRTAPDINITAGTATWTDRFWITNAGNTILNSTTDNGNNFQVTGTASISSQLNLGAGTATTAPISFTPTSAVLQTTPTAGDMEVDANGIAYYSHNTSSRGIIHAEQFISLTGTYTLTSQTAAQKAFNSTTNGALTAKAATSYYFEGLISLSSMSATSGSFGFALGGTATLTSITWTSNAVKAATLATAATNQMTFNATAANTTVATASTATNGYMFVKGIIRVNAAGTLIPSVSLGVAAAAVVGTNSYFRIIPIGTNTITNVGKWN